MNYLYTIRDALLHLAFPHICEACGSDIIETSHHLCLRCLEALPRTNYHMYAGNPIEKLFWGRLPLNAATSQFYFTKDSMIQHLMHELKYRGNKDLGHYLGRLMGQALQSTNRFNSVDLLIPLPLHPSKERKRGYNQATVLCEGITSVWKKKISQDLVYRIKATESQTRKNRLERWKNMEQIFAVRDPGALRDRHVLLVDDVITTGATMEACGAAILEEGSCRLSIATLCFAAGN